MKLYTKLFAIQGKVSVTKDGTNPHFRSKYMTLDNIVETLHPMLREYNLLVTHLIENGTLITRIVDIESSETLDSHFPMNATDPQKVGSEITYGKRYNLVALFNICADEDDDANSCSKNTPTSNANTQEVQSPTEWINEAKIKTLIEKIKSGEIMCTGSDEAVKIARQYFMVSKANAEAIKALYSNEIF